MTPAGARLMGAFIAHERAHGIPPTIRELGRVLGITTTAIHDTIKRLVADGHLERVGAKGSSHSIRLPRDPVPVGDAADRLRGAVLLALGEMTREQAWRIVDETLQSAPPRSTDEAGSARPRGR